VHGGCTDYVEGGAVSDFALLALVEEFGDLGDLLEVRWTTDEGEFVVRQSDLPHGTLFGDRPERVREATFLFGSGARVTVDFSEARND
jgi:hypothetical protein